MTENYDVSIKFKDKEVKTDLETMKTELTLVKEEITKAHSSIRKKEDELTELMKRKETLEKAAEMTKDQDTEELGPEKKEV